MHKLSRYSIILFTMLIVIISIPTSIVYASGCYDKFIFNWFSANDFFICIDNQGSGEVNTASNIGNSGNGVFAQKVLVDLQFKKLLSLNSGLIITNNSTNVLFNNTNTGETTVCANLGTVGEGIYVSGNCNFKKILAGTGISLSANGTRITITNTLPENTVCSNTGSSLDASICNGGNVSLKGFKESTGIDIVNNTNDITIKTKFANGTGISITGSTTQTFTNNGIISNSCSSPISCSGTNPSTISCPTCLTSESITQICQSASTTTAITCSNFTGYEYLQFYFWWKTSATGTIMTLNLQFNSDTSGNYAYRSSDNGGADTTGVSQTRIDITSSMACSSNGGQGCYYVCNVHNISSERKIGSCNGTNSIQTSSATAPDRKELVFKWDNTSSQITTISISRSAGTTTFVGGEITVFGWN